MKNVALNTKKKWVGSLTGTSLREQGVGSHLREEDNDGVEGDDGVGNNSEDVEDERVPARVGLHYISADDRRHLSKNRRTNLPTVVARSPAPFESGRTWASNTDGFLSAWSTVVYADTEESFLKNWHALGVEFEDQSDNLDCNLLRWNCFLLKCDADRSRKVCARHIHPFAQGGRSVRYQDISEFWSPGDLSCGEHPCLPKKFPQVTERQSAWLYNQSDQESPPPLGGELQPESGHPRVELCDEIPPTSYHGAVTLAC